MPFIDFLSPYFLLLLPVSWAWLLFFYIKEDKKSFPKKKRAAFIFRVLTLSFIVLAMADMGLSWKFNKKCVIYAVDVSKSIPKALKEKAYKWISKDINTLAEDDLFGLVAFSGSASAELMPKKVGKKKSLFKTLRFFQKKDYNFNTDLTNIANAIELSIKLFPKEASKEIVILTDGNENRGSVLDKSLLAIMQGVRLNFVLLDNKAGEINSLESVNLPSNVNIGERVFAEAVISSKEPEDVEFSVFINNTPYLTKKIHLKGEGKETFLFPVKFNSQGCFVLSSVLGNNKEDQARNHIDIPVDVIAPKHILYVVNNGNNHLVEILKSKKIPIKLITPRMFPDTVSGLEAYDSVIIDNVSSSSFSRKNIKILQEYVYDFGGGVVMVGGKRSFGAGGYFNTPVEKLLPVYMDVRNKNRKEALNVVFVLDKSQSMGDRIEINGPTKMELAIDASINALDSLKGQDRVGLVAFDNRVHKLLALTSLSKKNIIKKRLLEIHPEGKTNILLGMKAGYELLKNKKKQVRHMIVFSDGKPSEDGDYETFLKKLKQEKITLSSVGVGDELDKKLMRKLAEKTGGRLYLTEDIFNLSQIFKKDLAIASQSMVRVKNFTPTLKDKSPLTMDVNKLPELGGHILTTAKKSAIVPIVSDLGDPVVSYWSYGLGKSAVLTTDHGTWLSAWRVWEGFSGLWTKLVKLVKKTQMPTPLLNISLKRDKYNANFFLIDAINEKGEFLNNLPLKIDLFVPDGTKQGLEFYQNKPGQYIAYFEPSKRGVYSVLVKFVSSGTVKTLGKTLTFALYKLPEYTNKTANNTLLSNVAKACGGELISLGNSSPEWIRRYEYSGYNKVLLWQYLLALSCIIFVIGLLVERLFRAEHNEEI